MSRRLLALLPALLLAACSGGAPATLKPGLTLTLASASPSAPGSSVAVAATATTSVVVPSPSPAASPTPLPTATRAATPQPTPAPTATRTPTPTAAPTPSAEATSTPTTSEDPTDSTSRALVVATLLAADELPADLEPGPIEESETVNDPAFAANNGLRVVRIVWQGSGQGEIFRLFDYRYQFPNEDDAATFLEDAKVFLSESESGMAEGTDPEVGELSYLYTGEVEGLEDFNYNVLFRVGNVVAKIWANVASTQDPDVPLDVAKAAATKLTNALGLGAFPNPDEAAILAIVPAEIRESCRRADPIYRDEVDTITCDGSTDHPPIDYSLFRSAAALDGAFERDLGRADPAPTAAGQCNAGNYVAPYSIDGATAGRIMCILSTDDTGTEFRVIEWTSTTRRILAFMSSTTRTWDNLIEFWRDKAGPIR